MKNSIKVIIIISIFVLVGLIATAFYFIINDSNNVSTSVSEAISEVNEKNDSTIKDDIDWSNYTKKTINLENNITINQEGVYELNGTGSNISVNVNTKGNVKLILNNITINNSNNAFIIVEEADIVYIELVGNNSITTTVNDDINASIYSSDDLLLLGDGSLSIKSNIDGIASKDDLMIVSGTYIINSEDDGIRSSDSLYIKNGNLTIQSNGDAIKTTNEEKGSIYIEDGKFDIVSNGDGIESISTITIKNGNFNITSGNNNISTDVSTKGIKAVSNILIESATININSLDDSIHSNSAIEINGGEFTISSKDDALHADNTIIIKDGNIDIIKSYEGIEANYIIIDSGNIKVTSSDDGINVSGGANQTGNVRMDEFSDNGGYLKINSGNIYVNSSGDGLDSNGSIYVNGGYITVDGPTNSGNGSLDYNGEFIINDGTLIAVGSSGMAQSVSSNSTQNTVQINLNSISNGSIEFADIKYEPSKSYQNIIISSPNLELNKEYKLLINKNVYETYTLSQSISSFGSSNNSGPGGMNNRQTNIRR